MSKNTVVAIVAIIAMSAIIITLIIMLATQHGSTQTPQDSQGQTSTTSQSNGPLQDCMNQAHRQWDGNIATAEGTPGNAYAFDKSQLDQQLVSCHDQYGY